MVLLARLAGAEDQLRAAEALRAELRERIGKSLPHMPGWSDGFPLRTSVGTITPIKGSESAKYDTAALDVLCDADPVLKSRLARYRTVSVRPGTWKLDRRGASQTLTP